MKRRIYAAVSVIALCVACSKQEAKDAYCKAINSEVPTKRVAVRNLHVYGTMYDGSIAIHPKCLHPVFSFLSIKKTKSNDDAVLGRINDFNVAMYVKPSMKSGMFQFDGEVDVFPKENSVKLVDVNKFDEVSYAERDALLNDVQASRKK